MEIHAPIQITRNTFVYDVGVYRCTLELTDSRDQGWRWKIAEHVPSPLHAGTTTLLDDKVSGMENTAEKAIAAIEENLSRIDYFEQKETSSKYAG